MSRKITIDETDARILEQLQTDASLTNKELAEHIGLTPPPTLARVNNLKKKGYLKNSVAELNWEKLGFNYRAQVLLNINESDEEIFEALTTSTYGINNLNKMKKDFKIPSKVSHYSAYCIFRNEDEFIEAWRKIINKCQDRVDFQVWQVERPIVKNKAVPIRTMNIKV